LYQYFDYNYDGPPFELYGTGHLIALGIVAAVIAFLVWGWRNPTEVGRRRGRWLLFWAIFVVVSSWHIWNIAVGAWSVQQHLPLHLCSMSGILLLYMLATRDYRAYEIFFFIGIVGAGQTLITPEAGDYGLPHFRALQTLVGHGLIVVALTFITTIEGRRPTWKSVWKTMVAINVYFVVITPFNYLLGSNYMYTLRKPDSASLLDLLGPWPWYLFWTEFVALGLFVLLYLPFVIADRRSAHGMT
jgi:hypothetical integral membrane protein (TIGR02206 family)